MRPEVNPFRHESTGTWSYVVADRSTQNCAIIDPVLDFDAKSGRSSTASADIIAGFVREQSLTNQWILETHAHADHLSAAPCLQAAVGGQIVIGQGIRDVQRAFRDVLNLEPGFPVDGRQFDRLLADGDEFTIGSLAVRAIATPGHTSDSLSYLIGDAVFVGDSIFMPDSGTARCDFPGGDAGNSMPPFAGSTSCRARPACSSATTTSRAGGRRAARRRSRPSARPISTCGTARAKRTSPRCAGSATPRWTCRRCFIPQSSSISAEAGRRPRNRMAGAT